MSVNNKWQWFRRRSHSLPLSEDVKSTSTFNRIRVQDSCPKSHQSRQRTRWCSEVDHLICPSIASLKPGSVAFQTDQLMAGDRICSVNGINTARMRHEDVTTLLENVDDSAMLEIQYSIPNFEPKLHNVTTRITDVPVNRIDGTLGITLRGGLMPEHLHLSRPLIITNIRPNGPAHRAGLIRIGDRLLKVDGQPLTGKTLLEAQQMLRDRHSNTVVPTATRTILTIEYDVPIIEAVKYATGPLLVELERDFFGADIMDEEDFGVVLAGSPDGCFIECIVPGSTADRCGALSLGDQLLAVDEMPIDDWSNPAEVESLLRRARKLQVLPCRAIQRTPNNNGPGSLRCYQRGFPTTTSPGSCSTLTASRRCRGIPQQQRHSLYQPMIGGTSSNSNAEATDWGGGMTSYSSGGAMGVSHSEVLTVTLTADQLHGYGLGVVAGEVPGDIILSRIIPDSPAYRCGCLQVGDRLLSVNHQSHLILTEINALLLLALDAPSIRNNSRITLEVEFDVADTIVPSSGVFTVKLSRRGGPGLGVTIAAPPSNTVDPSPSFLISEIRRGSIAHRTGTLHAGDRLLAIDQRPLDRLSLDAAFDILQSATTDIVTLKVEKMLQPENSQLLLDSVVYTVELRRRAGPLGITIAGSEDATEPILLSRLTEGGVAQKTGALHPGDRLLAINGDSVERKPLSYAIRLLQLTGERVQLKVARTLEAPPISPSGCNDSAVHSWDSGGVNHCVRSGADIDQMTSVSDNSLLRFYSDANDTQQQVLCPSPLPLPSFEGGGGGSSCADSSIVTDASGEQIYHVTLYKDVIYDDYGFSVSDGLFEKGVYVNRIRKGGPADIIGLLKPYDRIVQVNDTKTKDFDCCLTVPLIAAAGDRIELIIARYSTPNGSGNFDPIFSRENSSIKLDMSIGSNAITKTF